MSEITKILQSMESGDPSAANRLLPLVYEELRKLASSRMRNESSTLLQATALVHEAYVRLVDGHESRHWNGRAHFFGAAAEAMRRILVEQARRRSCLRQGGGIQMQVLPEIACNNTYNVDRVLDIDLALTQLADKDPEAAEVVKLHIFAGLTLEEVADALQVSRATVYRNWAYARASLKLVLRNDGIGDGVSTPT